MKTFKQLYEEISTNVPVVSLEKNQVDLDDEQTVNEINRNLAITLEKAFSNLDEALNAAKKILSMYGIQLPKFDYSDLKKGKIVIPISQFKSSGESHYDVTAPFSERTEKHKFTFNYLLSGGIYDVEADVSDL
jgi:predicted RNase H-like HicB family nuclease